MRIAEVTRQPGREHRGDGCPVPRGGGLGGSPTGGEEPERQHREPGFAAEPEPRHVVAQRHPEREEGRGESERAVPLPAVSGRQPADCGERHQDPHQHLDEPQPARRHAVGRPEDLVGQQKVRRVIVVGQHQGDRDPDDRRHGDPRDGGAQVAHPPLARHRCEAEAAEVVARDTEQKMRAAPQFEQVRVRTDDQHDRGGPQRDAGFHRRTPPALGCAGGAEVTQWHQVPPGGQPPEGLFEPDRHRDVGQRVSAEVDEARVHVDPRGIQVQNVGEQLPQVR